MTEASLPGPHDKIQLLRRIELFASLNDAQLEIVAKATRLVEFKKEEVIYREGDQADALYIVVSGRLKVFTQSDGREKVYTFLHKGDSFGEISLLTGETHSATVKAQNDALVLELAKADFEEVINRIPALVLYLSRVLSKRLRSKEGRSGEFSEGTIIAVYSAAKEVGRTLFAVSLAASLRRETHREVVLLDMSPQGGEIAAWMRHPTRPALKTQDPNLLFSGGVIEQEMQPTNFGFKLLSVGHTIGQEAEERLVAPLLTYLTDSVAYVLIDLPTEVDSAVFKALTQSDIIYLVTDTQREHLLRTQALYGRLDGAVAQAAEKIKIVVNLRGSTETETTLADEEALLEHPIAYVMPRISALDAAVQPEGLQAMLDQPTSLFAVKVRRLARAVGNVQVGLALGSGAALGLAHIGVLKVLEREKIPIDIVAGTSMGALIAAMWTSGRSARDLEALARRFQHPANLLSLLDIGFLLPLQGFQRGHGVMQFLRKDLGTKTFADTWVPLKIIASNPWTREQVVFEDGQLVDAVRASIAIPGVFYPVQRLDDVLADGGVVNPVPVSVLRKAGARRVIAINCFPTSAETARYVRERRKAHQEEERQLSQRSFPVRAAHWLKHQVMRGISPSILDVLVRSMQMMEHEIAEVACQEADVTIRPTLPDADWMEFYHPDKFIQRGEQVTEQMLPRIRELIA